MKFRNFQHFRNCSHHAGHSGLQDEVVSSLHDRFPHDHQRVRERLLDGPSLEGHARFPQIRFLPNNVGRRWSPLGRCVRTRWCQFGRAEEEMVDTLEGIAKQEASLTFLSSRSLDSSLSNFFFYSASSTQVGC